MFGKRVKLFRLLGFQVRIDLSWLILAVLITWTLAQGAFPHYFENLSTSTYWFMGIAGAIGLFASIIFHELCHSLIARRNGLPMKGITLFIFGGVAEMDQEPPSAKAEFRMAIAGPLASIFFGLAFLGLGVVAVSGKWPVGVSGVIGYLSTINFILAGFNLLPAFPLDGGRVLRSALWGWKHDLRWATRISSRIGSGFGIALIILGIFNVVMGNFIGGLWWFLIGMFMKNASQMSYQQLIIRKALEGDPVRKYMVSDPVTVSPAVTVEELVENYIYKHHFKMFPVVENGSFKGYVTLKQVKEIDRDKRSATTVGEIMREPSAEITVKPEDDAMRALSLMSRNKLSRLIVADGSRLAGVIALKDMLSLLSLKIDLEDFDPTSTPVPHINRQ